MTTYFSSGGVLQGDLPGEEATRGGSREWTAETSDAVLATYERTSLAMSDRPDDFAALKEEALRQLKQKHRRRTAVLPGPGGSAVQTHDVKHLKDRQVTQTIIDNVMSHPSSSVADPSKEHGQGDGSHDVALFSRFRERLTAVALDPPTILVRYQDVTVTSKVIVGSHALPSLSGSVSSRLTPALSKVGSSKGNPPQPHVILDSVSGVLRPGRYTLLLGPPQSGKTTFLRTLAGLTRHTPGLKLSAKELTYNGKRFDQFVPERSAAYVSQIDLHYGELTVRETLEFSARCQGAGSRGMVVDELEAKEAEAGIVPDPLLDAFVKSMVRGGKRSLITEVVLRLIGLDHVSGTVVGNAMLRGISGGQKKRLSTGEVIVGPARALFADEISTGLDSNTTFEIIKALRDACHVLQSTMVVGLLQPAPETFDLFDDVILLAAGKVVYHGPKDEVLPFFEGIGFTVPINRGVADFLQEVTVPSEQEKYWADETRVYKYITPRSMQREFQITELWAAMEAELSHPYVQPVPLAGAADGGAGGGDRALATAKYGASARTLARAVASRSWILQKRTKFFAIIRTFQVALMALILASVFWREDRTNLEDGNYFMGVLFYSLLYQLLGGISEMHVLCDRLPVFHKQKAMRFYPGWAFAMPVFFQRVPYCFMEATIWTHIVYWLVGFSSSTRFLMFWLIMFLINAWSSLFFQLIAAVCRDDTISTATGSFFLLIFINISGFVINTGSVPPWWLEGLWPNPFFWAMRALAINEFTSGSWAKPNPARPSTVLGEDVLRFRGFPTDYWWCWAAVGFIIATGVINFLLLVAALSFLGPFKRRVVLTPEALEEHAAAGRASSLPKPKSQQMQLGVVRGQVSPAPPRGPHAVTVTAVATGGQTMTNTTTISNETQNDVIESPRVVSTPGTSTGPISPHFPTPSPVAGPAPSLPGVGPSTEGSFTSSFSRPLSMTAAERLFMVARAADAYRQRTAMPFTPVTLTFVGVEYSVPLPKDAEVGPDEVPQSGPHAGQLRLLRDINGIFRPNILTSLMGASGAGKTTLLDVLAGRKTGGLITGDIRVNGHPKEDATFSHVSAYVEQSDVHLPQASVREALEFSARLRLSAEIDSTTRAKFVSEVLELVELDRIEGAFVGVPGVSGLSVEQRKRLTLAVELVSNPSIVFLDEPTSGLDARAATVVMSAIRNTVNSGRTVVCTIHQPSYDIFAQFDELLLLKPGGRTVYFGPLGDGAQDLVEYLQSFPGVKPLPPRHNPANWMLEVTSAAGEEAVGIDFADAYDSSDLAKRMGAIIKQHQDPDPGLGPLIMGELHVASPWIQFTTCLHRFWRMYWRAPEYNLTRLAVTLGVAFVFGSLFWRQGDNATTVVGVLNIAGVLFSSCLFLGITDCLTVQHVVALQRTVMYRERAAGYYGVLPFALAQQVVEIPYLAGQSVIYSAIVYWMVWFARDAGKFFLFIMFFFLTLLYFVVFGMMAVALTPAVTLANVFCSFFFGFWNLFCGFLIPQPAMPVYYKYYWLYWINPVSWSLYGLSVSQLGDMNDAPIRDFSGQPTTVTRFLGDNFNWHRYLMWPIVPILLGFTAVFSCITIFALKKINYQRR